MDGWMDWMDGSMVLPRPKSLGTWEEDVRSPTASKQRRYNGLASVGCMIFNTDSVSDMKWNFTVAFLDNLAIRRPGRPKVIM